VSGSVHVLLAFTVLFPFVPSIISGTDTQPTFLLAIVFAGVVALAVPAAGARLFRITLPGAAVVCCGAAALFAWLTLANWLQPGNALLMRIGSFIQFSAALLWSYMGRFQWRQRHIVGALVVYFVFTIVYFATGGVIEEVLIRSRTEDAAFLFGSGRGARTLSPEPSFFALQVFNLFVLYRVLRFDRTASPRVKLLVTSLVVFCMAASFSAYAALLLVVVLAISYPVFTLGLVSVAFILDSPIQRSLMEYESFRGIAVLLTLIDNTGGVRELIRIDASAAGRLLSFGAYMQDIRENPVFGNGFALYQGGGLISIVAGLGLGALLLFITVAGRIGGGEYSVATKALLLVWLALNVISGPIGIPILGVIAGSILTGWRGRAPQPLSSPQHNYSLQTS
jgi:hypothetical protein